MAIEAAELLEHFLWRSDDESRKRDPDKMREIADEMGDVFIYLLQLGRTLDIDIIAAARDKLLVNREKYPVEKAKGRATKYLDLE